MEVRSGPPNSRANRKEGKKKKKAERKSAPRGLSPSVQVGAICWEGHQDADTLQPHTRQLRASTDWIEGGTRRPLLAAHPPRSHTRDVRSPTPVQNFICSLCCRDESAA